MAQSPLLCRWLWAGDIWVEDPSFPCECVDTQVCLPPAYEGRYIDEEAQTPCV